MGEMQGARQGAGRRTLAIGILAAGLGAAVGFAVARSAQGAGWQRLAWYAAAATAPTIMLLWWFAMERLRRFGTLRAALVGAAGGVLAHYPCWYLMILGENVATWYLGRIGPPGAEPPPGPLDGLAGAAVLSVWSLLLFGWLTAFIGAIATAAYAWTVRRTLRPGGN